MLNLESIPPVIKRTISYIPRVVLAAVFLGAQTSSVSANQPSEPKPTYFTTTPTGNCIILGERLAPVEQYHPLRNPSFPIQVNIRYDVWNAAFSSDLDHASYSVDANGFEGDRDMPIGPIGGDRTLISTLGCGSIAAFEAYVADLVNDGFHGLAEDYLIHPTRTDEGGFPLHSRTKDWFF
jgi:hypothetical protein